MKLIQFQKIGEAYELGRKLLAAGLYDNVAIANLQSHFLSGMYWEIETVKGYFALYNIVPGRDATITILLCERPKGKYREFLNELEAFKKTLFEDFGFLRLSAWVDEKNKASQLLCRRMGFTREGLVRHGGQTGPQIKDMIIFGLLREEALHGIRTRELLQPVAVRLPAAELRGGRRDVERVEKELDATGERARGCGCGEPLCAAGCGDGTRDGGDRHESVSAANRRDSAVVGPESAALLGPENGGNGLGRRDDGVQPVGKLHQFRPRWYAGRVWQRAQ